MNRAMEENDAVGVLEMACVMLEELGDPNHGVKGQVRVWIILDMYILECVQNFAHITCVLLSLKYELCTLYNQKKTGRDGSP